MHLEMYVHYLRRELPDYFRVNQKIHQAIVDAADNPLLSANYANLNSIVRRLRYSANLVRRDRLGDAMREHEQIVDALRRRSADELGLLMFEHIRSKCEAVWEYLRSRNRWIEVQCALRRHLRSECTFHADEDEATKLRPPSPSLHPLAALAGRGLGG
jgi:DNA-binding GntR family transcriptional regulator